MKKTWCVFCVLLFGGCREKAPATKVRSVVLTSQTPLPLVADVVAVYDPDLWKTLKTMTPDRYFQTVDELRATEPGDLHIWRFELVPFASSGPVRLCPLHKSSYGIAVFCDVWCGRGYRFVLTPFSNPKAALGASRAVVQEGRSYKKLYNVFAVSADQPRLHRRAEGPTCSPA